MGDSDVVDSDVGASDVADSDVGGNASLVMMKESVINMIAIISRLRKEVYF